MVILAKTASVLLLITILATPAVSQKSNPSPAKALATDLMLSSPAFPSAGDIPKRYTCEGENISPSLLWNGAPPRTASFVLIVDDPDAPEGTYTHWVVWNLPIQVGNLQASLPKRSQLGNGARQGKNSDGKIGYDGPCPPPGRAHRYFFRLYALDESLDLPVDSGRVALLESMKGHILGQAEYMGRYANSTGKE